jgi:DNA-binding NarL/FixJ family response regulator
MAAPLPRCEHQEVPVRATVLIVDDHDSFRRAAGRLLEASGFRVVGGVGTPEEALHAIEALRPDVVLLDIQLDAALDGFDVAERLAAAADGPAVVLVSSRDEATYGDRLARAPVRGFIPKSGLSGDALAALVG